MKRFFVFLLAFSVLFNASSVYACSFVFDFVGELAELGPRVGSEVTGQANSLTECLAEKKTLAALGSIQKILAKLKELKERVDLIIELFQKGLNLINESIEVAKKVIDLIEEAKEFVPKVKELLDDAVEASTNAVEFVKSADEYLAKYKETTEKTSNILNANDAVGSQEKVDPFLDEAEAISDAGEEYYAIAQGYIRDAQYAAQEVLNIFTDIANLYKDLVRLCKEVVITMERACMLKAKGQQYKAELRAAFCKDTSTSGVSKSYCKTQAEEDAAAVDSTTEACSTDSADKIIDVINEFNDSLIDVVNNGSDAYSPSEEEAKAKAEAQAEQRAKVQENMNDYLEKMAAEKIYTFSISK